MWLENLQLTHFRNYRQAEFTFAQKTTLILGPNASGKTNLLEAIFFLATAKSFKAESAQQMIHWQEKFAVVTGRIKEPEEEKLLLIQLQKEDGRRTKKSFFEGGVARSRKEFLPAFFAIVFRPEDIRLVSGPPSRRRNWLDEVLANLDWRYQRSLTLYRKALKQRNFLLDQIRQQKSALSELFYWDNALVKNGAFLIEERRKLVAFVNHFLQHFTHRFLAQLQLRYQPSPLTLERLRRFSQKDVENGWTSIGPHKDQLVVEGKQFETEDKNIAFWGSRAQQRLAILGLKLAQLEFVFQQTKRRPVLLLDDIFSELDEEQQSLLKDSFHSHQVIVTTARPPESKSFVWQQVIRLK